MVIFGEKPIHKEFFFSEKKRIEQKGLLKNKQKENIT